jgi:nitrogen fixation NifU-like protein
VRQAARVLSQPSACYENRLAFGREVRRIPFPEHKNAGGKTTSGTVGLDSEFSLMSPELIEHFRNPRNVGELAPPAITVEASNPVCGDILRLSALFAAGRIAQCSFKVRGGRDKTGLTNLTASDVEQAVGGLSNESKHAAALCLDAVRALLMQFPI